MLFDNKSRRSGIDWLVLTVTSILLLFGLISLMNVLSDSFDGTESGVQEFFARLNLEYIARQLGNILLSVAVAIPVAITDYKKYKLFLIPSYISLCVLLIVLILFGRTTRGIQGWFNFGSGSLSRAFQPSELSKVILIASLSAVASDIFDKKGKLKSFTDIVVCTLLFLIPFILVLLQPDFGTAMVMLATFLSIMFAAGISLFYVVGAIIGGAISLPLIYKYILNFEQKQRIRVFLDPTLDPQGSGYNVLRSKELIGSGGLTGKGFFSQGTLSQTGFVPERHTDFIFSSIAEGLGFIGCSILVLLYFILIVRFLVIAFRSHDTYGRCICIGCSTMLFVHVFENIGMNIGMMPVTGIPLPLISYGGSNLMTTLISFAMVISVNYRTVNRGQIQ